MTELEVTLCNTEPGERAKPNARSLFEQVGVRARSIEAYAKAEKNKIASAEAAFRQNTEALIDDIDRIETTYKLAYVGQAHGYDDGRYGATIVRVVDGSFCRLSVIDMAHPCVVEWIGRPPINRYDLLTLQAHTTPLGFFRTYEALLTDLANWIVSVKVQVTDT